MRGRGPVLPSSWWVLSSAAGRVGQAFRSDWRRDESAIGQHVKEAHGITGVERSLVFIYSNTIYAFSQQLGSPPPPVFSHPQVGRLRAERQHRFHPASPI